MGLDLWAEFTAPAKPAPSAESVPIQALFGETSTAYQHGFTTPGHAVGDSRDLHRVLELPRRMPLVQAEKETRVPAPELAGIQSGLEARLALPEAQCDCVGLYHRACVRHLLPIQAWALHEISEVGGLLGPIAVGDGKTLLGLLAPLVVLGCKTAVILVQPNLRDQLLSVDWHFYGQHWKLPNLAGGKSRWATPGYPWLHVVAFSELSGAKSTDLLERIKPDLVIVDEAQNLRRRDAARTKRFLRYMHANPATRLCAWSGTLTKNSLLDYAHLANLALRDKSPTPLHWPTAEEWAGAIDPSDFPAPIGKLAEFCQPGEHVHVGWRRRLHETRGVVASPEQSGCAASLLFEERKVLVPEKIHDMLLKLHASWQRPDGEELVDALSKARCARELACGFYYVWRWPRGESLEVREAWLEARKQWHRELRERLKYSREHLDSPLLCAKAAIRWYEGYKHEGTEYPPRCQSGPLPVWNADTWPGWLEIRDTAKPETEAIWESDFLARDAADWCRSNPGILWYEHDAFGKKVADLAERSLYGPGVEASLRILSDNGKRGIVASIRAHGTGKNLQAFSCQLVANPPSDGAAWEQLLGRTHRTGQLADEVRVLVYRHTDDMRAALDKARLLAAYIAGTMGGAQKLLRAKYLFDT